MDTSYSTHMSPVKAIEELFEIETHYSNETHAYNAGVYADHADEIKQWRRLNKQAFEQQIEQGLNDTALSDTLDYLRAVAYPAKQVSATQEDIIVDHIILHMDTNKEDMLQAYAKTLGRPFVPTPRQG